MNTSVKPVIALGLICVLAVGLSGCEKKVINEKTGVPENNMVAKEGLADDANVSSAVMAALQREEQLKAFNFHIETRKGDVTLVGEVDTPQQRMLAEQITLATAGAHTVQNKISVKNN
jgi:hyperosmotically inducible protein